MRFLLAILMTALLAAPAAAGESGASACEESRQDFRPSRSLAECLFRSVTGPRGSEAAAELERLAKQNPDEPWFTFYLGNLVWADSERAEALYQAAAAGFAASSDPEGEVLARGNRGQLLFHLGRVEESAKEAREAFERGGASGVPVARAHGSVVLAAHLFRVGENLHRARELLLTARDVPEIQDSPHLLKTCLYNLANVALAIGNDREALGAFEGLVGLSEQLDDPWLNASAHYGVTRVVVDRFAAEPSEERRRTVVESARRTLTAAERANHWSVAAKAHWILGVLLPWQEARPHLELCAEIAPVDREHSYCLNSTARRLAEEDPAGARGLMGRALELAETSGDPWTLAFTWSERMRVSWAAEPLDRAVADSWEALDRIETLRELQEDGSSVQAGLFSTWADYYHFFGGRLLEEARQRGRAALVAEAFRVSEHLRARALTDWLRATGEALVSSDRLSFATLDQVQQHLHPREALLAYQVAPWEDLAGDFGGGSWLIVVTRGSARAYPLLGRGELRRKVEVYTGLFDGRDGSEAGPSAVLYSDLLAPALAELPAGVDRLILVPDDALHRLPFGALRPAPDAPPLAATHRLTVAPSATLWLGWRRGAAAGRVLQASAEDTDRAPALVLAAPTTPAGAGGVAAAMDGDARDLLASDLPPLRHARREGQSVVAALGRGTELAMGARAAENRLARPDLGRFALLHLAAHAVTDEDHPERSAVVLAPAAAGDLAAADGLLQAGEIASLDLSGKLVVLSSCRSAAGTVLRGEGVMSLGRAFFQAGARTVLASLWPVRDDEAAVLFEAFYRHLARGEKVAAALQAAQAERRAAGAPASAWAAFVVLGDGDLAPVLPAPRPDPGLRLALIAAGILTALLLALAARRPSPHDLSDLAPSSPSPR